MLAFPVITKNPGSIEPGQRRPFRRGLHAQGLFMRESLTFTDASTSGRQQRLEVHDVFGRSVRVTALASFHNMSEGSQQRPRGSVFEVVE